MKSAPTISARSKGGLAALALAALAACASTDDSELTAARESWRGATYDQVLMAWGTPSQSGLDSHTWLAPQMQGSGGGVGGVLFGSPDGNARCDRTLAFRDGRVVDSRWTGDAAFCRQFARRR